MGEIETILTDVGAGIGSLFDSIGVPLATLVILLGIAGGIGAIIMAIASFIRKAF
jgi:hypothetical protein